MVDPKQATTVHNRGPLFVERYVVDELYASIRATSTSFDLQGFDSGEFFPAAST